MRRVGLPQGHLRPGAPHKGREAGRVGTAATEARSDEPRAWPAWPVTARSCLG